MKKKKDGEWENIERREWRGLFRWPFVIFMSIIINVEIILISICVLFRISLLFLRREEENASKLVRH